jgi:hypothetical protein
MVSGSINHAKNTIKIAVDPETFNFGKQLRTKINGNEHCLSCEK